jgi:hypothetical protein
MLAKLGHEWQMRDWSDLHSIVIGSSQIRANAGQLTMTTGFL